MEGLSRSNRLIVADYEGHRLAQPAASRQPPDPCAVAVDDAEPGDWDSVSVQTTEAQTRRFVTLYEALQDFDDCAAAVPPGLIRLAFAGSEDQIDYSPQWGGVRVSIGERLARHREALTAAGWDIQVLPRLDHLGAMHSSVYVLSVWAANGNNLALAKAPA